MTPGLPGNAEALDPPDWRAAIRPLAPALAAQPVSEASARLLAANGRWRAADAAYRELIAREPLNVGALRGYALVLRQTGRGDECVRMRRRALEAEAARLGLAGAARDEAARFLFAAEGGEQAPPAAPAAYVARAFDLYEDYDEHLVERLAYRAPAILSALVAEIAKPAPHSLRVLDLGCGTGLCGAALADVASLLVGVDISERMAERARSRGIYERVIVGDAVVEMRRGEAWDLAVAADVLPYIGDVAPLFAAAAAGLVPGGLLVCTAEALEGGDGVALRGTRRFAHAEPYLRACAAAAGLEPVAVRREMLRTENGEPVCGLALALRR